MDKVRTVTHRSRPYRSRVGRGVAWKIYTARLDTDTARMLEASARAENISRNELIRRAIIQYCGGGKP